MNGDPASSVSGLQPSRRSILAKVEGVTVDRKKTESVNASFERRVRVSGRLRLHERVLVLLLVVLCMMASRRG